LKEGQTPKPFKDLRNPEVIGNYLKYIQSDPDWQTQAQADLQDPANVQRYMQFVQQIQKKWQEQAAQEAAQQPQGWRAWLPFGR
jgi:hypothetical protein